jgi:hypothetical protein
MKRQSLNGQMLGHTMESAITAPRFDIVALFLKPRSSSGLRAAAKGFDGARMIRQTRFYFLIYLSSALHSAPSPR